MTMPLCLQFSILLTILAGFRKGIRSVKYPGSPISKGSLWRPVRDQAESRVISGKGFLNKAVSSRSSNGNSSYSYSQSQLVPVQCMNVCPPASLICITNIQLKLVLKNFHSVIHITHEK